MAPVNAGKAWTARDCRILVRMLHYGASRSVVADKLGRSEYGVQCREERIKKAGQWDRLLVPQPNNENEGEDDMSADTKKEPFLRTETVTTTYLLGRDASTYTDAELMALLVKVLDKRDQVQAQPLAASTKYAQAQVMELTANANALVELMDRLYDERQANEKS